MKGQRIIFLDANGNVTQDITKPVGGGSRIPINGMPGRSPSRMPNSSNDIIQGLNAAQGVIVENTMQGAPVGGVSQVEGDTEFAQSVTLVFDNSASATDTLFRIGSPLAAALLGFTALPTATSGSNDIPAIYESFRDMPVTVKQIHAQTDINPRQLAEPMIYYRGKDIDGSMRASERIPLNLAPRPTYQNDLLLILQATKQYRLGQMEQITWNVLAGETPVLNFALGFLTGR